VGRKAWLSRAMISSSSTSRTVDLFMAEF
jgi:hypothetical protein